MHDLTCCHQPTNVCHVRHEPGIVLVCNCAHARVVIVAGVGRCACYQQLGPVQLCIGLQLVIVNQATVLMYSVRECLQTVQRSETCC